MNYYTNGYGGWRDHILKERVTGITMNFNKRLYKGEHIMESNGYVNKENRMISYFDPSIIPDIGNTREVGIEATEKELLKGIMTDLYILPRNHSVYWRCREAHFSIKYPFDGSCMSVEQTAH